MIQKEAVNVSYRTSFDIVPLFFLKQSETPCFFDFVVLVAVAVLKGMVVFSIAAITTKVNATFAFQHFIFFIYM